MSVTHNEKIVPKGGIDLTGTGVEFPPSTVSGSPTGGIEAWKAHANFAVNKLIAAPTGIAVLCLTAHESGATFSGIGAGGHWMPITNPSSTPEFYGAKGDGVTDDSAAFEELSKKLTGEKGGVANLYAAKYVAEFKIRSGVKWVARGRTGTQIKGVEGSSKTGVIELENGAVESSMDGIQCIPRVAGQWQFYLAPTTELSYFTLRNMEIGVNSEGNECNGIWYRGISGACQFIKHENCTFVKPATEGSRCLLCTSQVEHVGFDEKCVFDGPKGTRTSVLVELGREFLLGTTMAAESAVNATVIELTAIPAGLEANKVIRIGDGRKAELATVQSIEGKKVTLKAVTEAAHASGTQVYLLSGTVAAPTKSAPSIFNFNGGAIQNSDLCFLIDTGVNVVQVIGTDAENQHAIAHMFPECFGINFLVRSLETSEGTNAGTAVATIGSAVLTAASAAWVTGEHIAGPGVPFGATVLKVEGATVEISAPIEANGTEGASTINLTRGGNGEGYIARADKGAQGTFSYYQTGATDRGFISKESAFRVRNLSRGSAIAQVKSSGLALSKATAESLSVQAADEVFLTNAAATIKTIMGFHAPGERIVFVASANATKFANGGNSNISLMGATTLTLEANDVCEFICSDKGARYALIGVRRASEGASPTWKEVEEVSAKLETEIAGHRAKIEWAKDPVTGKIVLRGWANTKEALVIGSTLFKLPAAARPPVGRLIPLGGSNNYLLEVEAGGVCKLQVKEAKVNDKIDFESVLPWSLV
jgi:hypothetical protein